MLNLRHEDQTESARAAEYYEDREHDEHRVLLVGQHETDRRAGYAHDHHVVHAHADVLAVVQRGDAHVPRLPGEEGADHLETAALEAITRAFDKGHPEY